MNADSSSVSSPSTPEVDEFCRDDPWQNESIEDVDVEDLVNLSSNPHAQHGMERYPEASQSVANTGTHGVSSSAWFPMRKTPGLKKSVPASFLVSLENIESVVDPSGYVREGSWRR